MLQPGTENGVVPGDDILKREEGRLMDGQRLVQRGLRQNTVSLAFLKRLTNVF